MPVVQHDDCPRFIPASAGNTADDQRRVIAPTVHPRERGEHLNATSSLHQNGGSSPRARGTLAGLSAEAAARRFIPASAGNTVDALVYSCALTVHPRERGEHQGQIDQKVESFGSSPRARGTRTVRTHGRNWRRFIPASAGNTAFSSAVRSLMTVHPRERGEHDAFVQGTEVTGGSSPRARGTPVNARQSFFTLRFIPASAGNTNGSAGRFILIAVHPRERGEHS